MTQITARKKPLTKKQAQVMKIIRAGGCLFPNPLGRNRYRVLDFDKNPVLIIQQRTFLALSSSERIVQDKEHGIWIRKPLKSKRNGIRNNKP